MIAFLRKNNAEIRHKLAKAGMVLCKCSEFDGANWLDYSPDCYYEIHGVGFVSDEFPNKEENLNTFLKGIDEKKKKGEDVRDFRDDVEGFVEFCKKYKEDSTELGGLPTN